jgi:hypothetical protein
MPLRAVFLSRLKTAAYEDWLSRLAVASRCPFAGSEFSPF